MSIAITRWPSSAKQVAVTRPTQPTPITPMDRSFAHLSLDMIAAALATRVAQPLYLRIDSAMPNIWPGVSTLSRVLSTQ